MPTKTDKKRVPAVTIKNAKLRYANFAGAPKKFNAEGLRNFHVVLDADLAQVMERDGWNVRWHEPKEDGDQAWASLKVAVRFDNYPPRIVMIVGDKKTMLDEESVGILDWAKIEKVDLIVTPSAWDVSGKQGIKAYLQKMFVTLSADDLEAQYISAPSHDDAD